MTKMLQTLTSLALLASLAGCLALASSVQSGSEQPAATSQGNLAILDSPQLRLVSDEDQASMQHIKNVIQHEYSDLRTIQDVHAFLDKVRLLDQKHPKNVAFAQGDLKDLHKFLSQEIVGRLRRVDTEYFVLPINDDRTALAQKAVDEDELTRKLFGQPLRSMIEARKQQMSRSDDGNHKDGNFFANFWCKVSGSCSNQ